MTRRIGIHEADFTCQQLTTFFKDRVQIALTRGEAEKAELLALHACSDNKGYFDWLFSCKQDEEIAPAIKLGRHKEFSKESEPFVKDLLNIELALQSVIGFCENCSNETIHNLTKAFQAFHDGYIDFANKVLRKTKIPYRDLKKALRKFSGLSSWQKFKLKFPGILAN